MKDIVLDILRTLRDIAWAAGVIAVLYIVYYATRSRFGPSHQSKVSKGRTAYRVLMYLVGLFGLLALYVTLFHAPPQSPERLRSERPAHQR
jgi:hypothetical protein